MNLPKIDGVRYVVSWQNHCDAPIPDSLSRKDIDIFRFDGCGLSRNRNNSINNCTSDIILFADDDTTLTVDGIHNVMDAFQNNPDVDLFTFKHTGTTPKKYPPRQCRLSIPLPQGYYVSSIEIAFRRSSGKTLKCHPEFGLGSAKMHGGEDELLLLTAIHRGLNCQYIPLNICSHQHESTGDKSTLSDKNLRAMGCIIALTYPATGILRIPLKAWRTYKARQASLIKALWYLSAGAIRAPFLFPDKEYLW